MAEYSGHEFTMNWNSCFDTADTIIKIYFYWFTSIGLAAITIGSRPKDLPFWRKPVDVGDWTSFLLDWIMILSSTSIVPLYLILDKPRTWQGYCDESNGILVGLFVYCSYYIESGKIWDSQLISSSVFLFLFFRIIN